jgi:hypothetical protein
MAAAVSAALSAVESSNEKFTRPVVPFVDENGFLKGV